MQEELDALIKNDTWELDPKPKNQPVVGCKWVYTIKLQPDGSLDRYKARLVAQGYKQQYGIDYGEIFALVAKMTTVRTLIAVGVVRNWDIYQMNVKNSFLNGDLFCNSLHATSSWIFKFSKHGLQITERLCMD